MSSPRNYPASEVFVSGTFDDWAKSVKLEKKGEDLHEKLVELPRADEKIHYKVGRYSVLGACSNGSLRPL